MASCCISHFTPYTFLYFLIFLFLRQNSIIAVNITDLLSAYPDFSDFSNLLTTTSVAADLNRRSSLTLLAVPNAYFQSSDLAHYSPANLADVIRYHVLLEYLSLSDFLQIPAAGKLITTLYQTTGRAINNFGSVNITRNPQSKTVSVFSPAAYSSPSNATILSLIKTIPYNVSIFSVDSFIVPFGSDLMASETRPPMGINITKVLLDGHNFNVATAMLMASGVVEGFQRDAGAGITLFVPTDDAFSDLPVTARFQSLPADQKTVVLRFHVLHSYYPLGSLQSIVNPVQPTLATEDMGAGSYTLNISRVNGSVGINTGIVQASVTQTVFDQNPISIFGISRVLLPKELFGNHPILTPKPDNTAIGVAQPPEIALSPESYGPPSHLSAPPGFRQDLRSEAAGDNRVQSFILALFCTGLYLLV